MSKAPILDLYRGMNKLEKARAIELEALRRTGHLAAWWFEGVTLKLADECRLTLDFLIQENNGSLRFEETKGFLRGDASVKYRVAAKLFPFPIAVLYRDGPHGWKREEY